MKDHGTSASVVLDRMQRVNHLSRDLPQELRASDLTTLSLPDHALADSPNGGKFTTLLEKPSVTAEPLLRMVNSYRVISVLGRGGMGVVFKATDPRLNRTVAIKMLLGAIALDPKHSHRFAVEGEALARLEHPNVVTVYEASDWDGVPYYTMKFVPGGTLADNAERLRRDRRKAVAVAAKIARAVAYLHENGVSHRDLKPANILIGENDEPLVADFGLAKFHDTDSSFTMTGCLLGTRYYMAPEQTRGHHESLTPACDLWSVGVIIYELLSGKLPFTGESHDELFEQIREAEPPPLVGGPDESLAELNAVVMRCLAKNPADRYATGIALAEDLERWLAGEKVQAAPPARKSRRGRTGALLIGGVAAMMIAVVGYLFAGGRGPREITLIGPSAIGVNTQSLTGSNAKIGRDEMGRLTVDADGVAFIPLANSPWSRSYWMEATLQQMSTSQSSSSAGIYCRGRVFDRPGGPALHCCVVSVDGLESEKATKHNANGYGECYAGRWDNAEKNPWSTKVFPGQILMQRTRLNGINAPPSNTIRIEINEKQEINASINGIAINPISNDLLNEYFSYAVHFDAGPPLPAADRFGDAVGLYLEDCEAAFSNVRIGALK